jgi:LAO/AO transport system kinase
MEIPDVIAVNKMDHPAAHAMAKEVRSVVALDPDRARRPPVLLTEAMRGEGVPELWAEIEHRREALAADGRLEERRRRNLASEVLDLAAARARRRIERSVGAEPALTALVERVARRELDPVSAAEEIVTTVLGAEDDGPADPR